MTGCEVREDLMRFEVQGWKWLIPAEVLGPGEEEPGRHHIGGAEWSAGEDDEDSPREVTT